MKENPRVTLYGLAKQTYEIIIKNIQTGQEEEAIVELMRVLWFVSNHSRNYREKIF